MKRWGLALLVLAVLVALGVAGLTASDGGRDAADQGPSEAAPTSDPPKSEDPGPEALPRAGRCRATQRGLPACDLAWLGASVGFNDDPMTWEKRLGRPLPLRRTYWGGDDIDEAVETARLDLRSGRIPWISFKLPYSWAQMAQGRGDDWASDLASRLSQLDGPVWVAFHHEPEGDGDVAHWTSMQARLAPLVRRLAPNVAYTVVLTGYHQLNTEDYSFDRIWPRETTVDVAAFDVYNLHGVTKDGRTYDRGDLRASYWEPLSRWAESAGVAWGIGETGYSETAAQEDPEWLSRTYRDVVGLGAVAMTYFNSDANSITDWRINTERKRGQFRELVALSPRYDARER